MINADDCTPVVQYQYGSEPFIGLSVVSPGTDRCVVSCGHYNLSEERNLSKLSSNAFFV